MLCCLFSLASIARVSARLTGRPSIWLTTRWTYCTSNGGISNEGLAGEGGSGTTDGGGAIGVLLLRRWFCALFLRLPSLPW